MTAEKNRLPAGGFAKLAPELAVTDLAASLRFWCDGLGFVVAYQRPENGFAYIERDGVQFMLETVNGNWETGLLEKPFGRGLNFQIKVADVIPLLESLKKAAWPLFLDCHDAWYAVSDIETGNRQFLVQDPDGYLLRFVQDLGQRPVKS